MTPPRTHRIAVIAGDGIGQEVMPEALRAIDAVQRRFGFADYRDDPATRRTF